MARNSRKTISRRRGKSGYVQGNAVRKLQVAGPYSDERKSIQQINEERQNRRIEQRKIHRANQLNALYTLGVTMVVALFFFICYQFLNLQSEVKINASAVSELQEQLNTITNENDELEMNVESNIDYDSIYRTAVDELGMVYPEKGQVIPYRSGESEYVKQYQDIPNAN